MPPLHLFFYFLFGTALFGGGGAIIQNMTPPVEKELSQPAKPQSFVKRQVPDKKQAKATPSRPAVSEPSASLPAITPPSFDIVRIEPNGDGVIAGRAEPGWEVVIQSGGDKIETAMADKNGEWVVILSKPLPPGEYAIGLSSYGPGGTRGVVSAQEVTVSVAKHEKSQEAIVALSQPGKPTQVLSSSNEAIGEPAKAKTDEKPAAETPPAKPVEEMQVVVNAVDYEQDGKGGGTVFLSGAANSGKRVSLYLDNEHVGDVIAGDDGRWTYSVRKELQSEITHKVRADALNADGQVMSRAEVPFTPRITVAAKEEEVPRTETERSEMPQQLTSESPQTAVPPMESVTAKLQPPSVAEPAMPPAKEVSATQNVPRISEEKKLPIENVVPEKQMAKTELVNEPPVVKETARPQPAEAAGTMPVPSGTESVPPPQKEVSAVPQMAPEEKTVSEQKAAKRKSANPPPKRKALPSRIIVRRGDTLWSIAKRRYGKGHRYTAIYRQNRRQIRNPDLIYPGQIVRMPLR